MNQQAKAPSLAYKLVTTKLKLSMKDLSLKTGLDPKTLRRIRDGKCVKQCSYVYALSCFYEMIEDEYQKDLADSCGENSVLYLRFMRIVLREFLGKRDNDG